MTGAIGHVDDPLLRRAIDAFAEHFDGAAPHHAVAAPGRVRLIGEYTEPQEGFVLSMAIDRRTIMVAAPNHSQRCRVIAADLDGEQTAFINDASLSPGRTRWANYVKTAMMQFMANGHRIPSFDAVVASDVPIGAGLGAGTSLTVAAATLVEHLLGFQLDAQRKAQWCNVAESATQGETASVADALAIVMAHRGEAMLIDTRSRDVHHVPLDESQVAVVLALPGGETEALPIDYSAHRSRYTSGCESAVAAVAQIYPQVRVLRDVSLTQLEAARGRMDAAAFGCARHVIAANQRAQMMAEALQGGDFETAGFLMAESHRYLRNELGESRADLEQLVELAGGVPGVFGSRMAGRSGRGFTITLCRADSADALIRQLQACYRDAAGGDLNVLRVTTADAAAPLPLVAAQ